MDVSAKIAIGNVQSLGRKGLGYFILPQFAPYRYSCLDRKCYIAWVFVFCRRWRSESCRIQMGDRGYPTKVTASASAGIATSPPYECVPQTEDTITLLVDWAIAGKENTHRGTAVYTASWTAPTTQGIHSAQHWHYMGSKGDIQIDQAHRGYDVTVDGEGKSRSAQSMDNRSSNTMEYSLSSSSTP